MFTMNLPVVGPDLIVLINTHSGAEQPEYPFNQR